MKVQQTPTLKLNSKNQQTLKHSQNSNSSVTFGNAGAIGIGAQQFMRFLDTNQAWGANFVDVAFMVVPRSAFDFINRGPDVGFETTRRESSGTINHSAVGAYGLGAGWLLAQGLNKAYGVKAHQLFANDPTLDAFGQIWHEELKANPDNVVKNYLSRVVDGLEGFTDGNWKPLNANEKNELKTNVINSLESVISPDKKLSSKELKKLTNEKIAYAHALIGSELGAENLVRFKDSKTGNIATFSLKEMLENACKLGTVFNAENVKKAFMESANFVENKFINGLKKLSTRTSLVGLGVAAAVGCCIQPLNMYLTKKKTGKSGFVGSEGGGEPDKSFKFKLAKAATTGVFGGIVLSTIIDVKFKDLFKNPKNLSKLPKELLSKIKFKGFTPSINQFKLIYGLTVMSRFVVARDKNELRESATKDTLGFLNWMVLGGFVSKLTALAFEKSGKLGKFLNYNEAEHGKGLFNKITKPNIVTRDEVLLEGFKKLGISVLGDDGKALSYKGLLKRAKDVIHNNPEIKAEIKAEMKNILKKINRVNTAQLAGYAYSGLVLGLGLPKLNASITHYVDKKNHKKNKELELAQVTPIQTTAASTQPASVLSLAPATTEEIKKQGPFGSFNNK